jgi:hypothetical protein
LSNFDFTVLMGVSLNTILKGEFLMIDFRKIRTLAVCFSLTTGMILASAQLCIAETIDNVPPTATVTKATVLSMDSITTAKSSEAGTVYLVPKGIYSSKADLESAVNEMTGTKANAALANTNTTIVAPTTEGDYYLYAVDQAENVSAASTGFITVMKKFDCKIKLNVGRIQNATSLVADKRLEAVATITNYSKDGDKSSKLDNCMIVLVLYDAEGSMVNVRYKPVTIGYDKAKSAYCTVITSVGFNLPPDVTGYTAKAFIWDSIPSWSGAYWNDTGIPKTNMNPLSDIVTISQ